MENEWTLLWFGSAVALGLLVSQALVLWGTTKEVALEPIEVPMTEFEEKDEIQAPVKEKMELVWESRPGKLQCFDPSTMQHLGEVDIMTREQVNQAIEKARKAQLEWEKSTFSQRRAVLRAILDFYVRHQDDIARVCCRDSGKTKLCSLIGEITPTCEKLRWMIEYGEEYLKPDYRGGQGLMTMHKSIRVEYEPVGVLGVFAPFNYVAHNLLNHIISGIFSGNAVVCKVSEYTSWSADYLMRPVRKAIEAAGFSSDLVQVVTGLAETGVALAESNVDKIIFTGSDKVGRFVMKSAAERLTPLVLELGGKDPFIMCEDVDLKTTVPVVLRGVFQGSGQNCAGIERVFVHESLHDRFVEMALEIVREMRQGIPLKNPGIDIGAMTMPGAIEHIQSLVDDAVSKGAKLVIGGKRNEALKPGQFFEPTILTGVTADMKIAHVEVFGPVLAVRAWSDEEDMIKQVNDCPYALGSSVFCKDTARARRIGKRVRAGMTNVNDFGINYICQSLPFGGIGCSGFGRFAGPEGLRACCNMRSMTDDRIPGVHTTLPQALSYPLSYQSTEVAKHLVGMQYASGITARAKGLMGLLTGILFYNQPVAQGTKKLD